MVKSMRADALPPPNPSMTRMNNAANLLKGGGANIDEFVKRSNNLRIVQKHLPKYKQKFYDIQQMRNIIIDNKFEMKKEDISAFIDTMNVMKRLEQTILSAEELAERNVERYITLSPHCLF